MPVDCDSRGRVEDVLELIGEWNDHLAVPDVHQARQRDN